MDSSSDEESDRGKSKALIEMLLKGSNKFLNNALNCEDPSDPRVDAVLNTGQIIPFKYVYKKHTLGNKKDK